MHLNLSIIRQNIKQRGTQIYIFSVIGFFLIMFAIGSMVYYATLQIDYVWRWYKIPQYLEILSSSWSKDYGYATYEGQIKNISSLKLENVQAVVTWYDRNGNMITSSSALIEDNPILPGQSSPFKVMKTYNPAMKKAGVEFSYLMGGTIRTYQKSSDF